ncbi:solute carrier family 22 member 15-like [Hydractinia symbiolongicarpus]|uniref:solute carrier family 22 member 15-like n=1 Tax=Hydractinia symbiolongicarpus TaxID=13093 RepID=UPI0025505227|nr:solute carrier family 22 member 15-like [Hydractinia symbiolongicarpus]
MQHEDIHHVELLELNGNQSQTREVTLDSMLVNLGRPGLYHLINTFILKWILFFVCTQFVVVSSSIGITPRNFRCQSSLENHTELAITLNTSAEKINFGNCHVTVKGNVSKELPCDSWTYMFTKEEGEIDSIVTKWDLVCDKKFLPQLSTSLFFVGVMIGTSLLHHLPDKHGRRPTLLLFLLLSITVSAGTALVDNLILFLVLRFTLGVLICVAHTTANICAVELYPTKYNDTIGTILSSLYIVDILFGNTIAWLMRSWWKTQLIFAVPTFIPLIVAYFFLPESLRWLIIHDRQEDVKRHLQNAARINGVTLGDLPTIRGNSLLPGNDTSNKRIPFRRILSYKEMRKRLFAGIFLWIGLALSFYGLAFNVKNLSRNPYLSLVISSAVDTAPIATTILFMKRLGKRRLVVIYSFIGGVFSIIYKFYNHLAIMMVGKMFCAISFTVIYFYTMDIFPTEFRTRCFGACIMTGRLGSLLAPQLVAVGTYTSADIPVLVSGIFLFSGAFILYFFLPETSNIPTPDKVEDVENYKQIKKDRKMLVDT